MNKFLILFALLIGCSQKEEQIIQEKKVEYSASYSEYSECPSSNVCNGEGIQSRTIISCLKTSGETITSVDVKFCEIYNNNSFLNKSCFSPAGMLNVNIPNGIKSISCLEGSSIEKIDSIICNYGFNNVNNNCVEPHPLSYSLSISAGEHTTCAIGLHNKIYCWGQNESGQLGNGNTNQYLSPVEVYSEGALAGKKILKIDNKGDTTCVLSDEEKLYCWGNNYGGELGLYPDQSVPHQNPIEMKLNNDLVGKTIKDFSVGSEHICVIASDYQVYCWGSFQPTENSPWMTILPTAVVRTGVLSGKTIKKISTTSLHTCVIASDDKVYCWGYNYSGQLGNNSTINSLVPVAVDDSRVLYNKKLRDIYTSYSYTCAIDYENQAYCWGLNNYGQLGNNSRTSSSVPVGVELNGALFGKTIKSLALSGYTTCAIASDSNVYCWGSNSAGEWGNGTNGDSLFTLAPVPILNSGVLKGKFILGISSSNFHFCIIATDHQSYCWGYNNTGQLGNNSLEDSAQPVKVEY